MVCENTEFCPEDWKTDMTTFSNFTADPFTDAADEGQPGAGIALQMDAHADQNDSATRPAMEMGLSEPAFVTPSNGHHSIRYCHFHHQKELPCG